MPTDTDYDAQDTAEVLDETNLTDDGEDIANFDDIDDVYDVTQAEGDNEEDEENLDDLDDEALAEIDDLEGGRDDEGLDIEREPLDAIAADDEDGVADDQDQPSDFESTSLDANDREMIADAKRD
jgi:hypothetical protein